MESFGRQNLCVEIDVTSRSDRAFLRHIDLRYSKLENVDMQYIFLSITSNGRQIDVQIKYLGSSNLFTAISTLRGTMKPTPSLRRQRLL